MLTLSRTSKKRPSNSPHRRMTGSPTKPVDLSTRHSSQKRKHQTETGSPTERPSKLSKIDDINFRSGALPPRHNTEHKLDSTSTNKEKSPSLEIVSETTTGHAPFAPMQRPRLQGRRRNRDAFRPLAQPGLEMPETPSGHRNARVPRPALVPRRAIAPQPWRRRLGDTPSRAQPRAKPAAPQAKRRVPTPEM
jgi:hypothetical protein